jgi:Mrp family chromosome partitioning ATPase
MTALDRSFIRAYVPKEAAPHMEDRGDGVSSSTEAARHDAVSAGSSASPMNDRNVFTHSAERSATAPHTVAASGDIWAALQKPIHSSLRSAGHHPNNAAGVANGSNVAAKDAVLRQASVGAATPPSGRTRATEFAPASSETPASAMPSTSVSTRAAEAEAVEPQNSKSSTMRFASYASEMDRSGETTLSAYMRLRNAAARADRHEEDAASSSNGVIASDEAGAALNASRSHDDPRLATSDASESLSPSLRLDPAHLTGTAGVSSNDPATSPTTPAATSSPSPATPEPFQAMATSVGMAGVDEMPIETPIGASLQHDPWNYDALSLDPPASPTSLGRSAEWRPRQVERFTWPKICRRLITRASDQLDRLTDALLTIKERGQNVLALSGWHYGEGATTLLLCAARRLAERGIRPILVDADPCSPRLAKRLGIQPESGWNQATGDPQGVSLDKTVIEATVSGIALAPAFEPPADDEHLRVDPSQLAGCLGALRQRYDLVLVDVGPLENISVRVGPSPSGIFEGVDAIVLVRDLRLTSLEQAKEIHEQLSAAGVAMAGIIENFAEA